MLANSVLDPNNKFWANDTSRFGFQMLQKMGWCPGKGLGKTEQGSTTHIQVVKKEDRIGIGGKSDTSDAWIQSSKDYESILVSLTAVTNGSAPPKKEDSPQSSQNTVDKGESKKSDDKSKAAPQVTDDGSEKSSPQIKKQHKHWIPTRTIKGKNVASYSRNDLSAIFGFAEYGNLAVKETPPVPPPQNDGGIVTVTSTTNSRDYFKQKRQTPSQEKPHVATDVDESSKPQRQEKSQTKKKRKREREEQSTESPKKKSKKQK